MIGRWLAALLLVGGVRATALAQEQGPVETPEQTVSQPDSAVIDSGPVSERATQSTPGKSPGTAVLLSALIPGGGQVYTGGYWKAALIAPAEVALGYFSVKAHLDATEALREGREDDYVVYRDRRTTFLWWTGAVIAFSMAEAYVSAQLHGFDEQMRFSQSSGSHRLSSIAARVSLAVGPTRAGIRIGL